MNKGKVDFDQFKRAIEKIGVAMNEFVSAYLFNIHIDPNLITNCRTLNLFSRITTLLETVSSTSRSSPLPSSPRIESGSINWIINSHTTLSTSTRILMKRTQDKKRQPRLDVTHQRHSSSFSRTRSREEDQEVLLASKKSSE